MAVRFPHRVWQTATYHTGTPNYINVLNGTPAAGKQTFEGQAAKDSAAGDPWTATDEFGIVIIKNDITIKVWTATWDSVNQYLLLDTEEESSGSWGSGDEVTVFACPTKNTLAKSIAEPGFSTPIVVSGTTLTLSRIHNGRVLRFTSGSPVAVTIPSGLPVMHCLPVQVGDGTVVFTPSGVASLNGGTSGISLSGKMKSGYLYHIGGDDWEIIV